MTTDAQQTIDAVQAGEATLEQAGLYDAAQDVVNVCNRMIAAHDDAADDPATVRPDVIHAYRFEYLPDGSVVAVWASDHDPTVIHLTSFPDGQAANLWTPRNEYAGWTHTVPPKPQRRPAEDVAFTVAGAP